MILIGNRISLYPITEAVIEPFYEAFSRMDDECRIMTGTRNEITIDKVRDYAKRVEKSNEFHFYIEYNHTSKIIGELALTDIDRPNKNANFRFSIYSPEYRNLGLGSESLQLALDFGFNQLKLHRIYLTVYEKNQRAIHLYKKFGFTSEGLLREVYYYDNKYHNGIQMSILESEYR